MAISKQAHLDLIENIKTEFISVIQGMDYCLDWKQEESEWSVRELIYHILDTPPGGAHNLISGIISGDVQEYEIWSDLTNMTPERASQDIEQIKSNIDAFFRSLSDSVSCLSADDLKERKALMHQRTREVDEERSLEDILGRTLNIHIQGHLIQLRSIREALAI